MAETTGIVVKSENITDFEETVRTCVAEYGAGGSRFADAIIPTPPIDGQTRVFTLPDAPDPPSSLLLIKRGLKMRAGAENDFVLEGVTITYAAEQTPGLAEGDWHEAYYRY